MFFGRRQFFTYVRWVKEPLLNFPMKCSNVLAIKTFFLASLRRVKQGFVYKRFKNDVKTLTMMNVLDALVPHEPMIMPDHNQRIRR